ncbi:uncharacterized protein [Euphorbia lathyris]|uniref:uncharacterized protein n=1 Tax=Euphorbia lathyris TaxID=212925 RepID=UPI00331412F7
MTMLGMQADMQCHYFPSYFSTRDVNLNANCSVWPSSNADNILMNGHYYNGNLAPPFPDQQYLAYKDKLKQIMLQHEAIFKSQVHELHRLYNRQRELMVEVKRSEFGGQHLQLENSTSNQILSETSFEYKKKTCIVSAVPWLNPTHGQSFVPSAENNYVQGNMVLAGSSSVQTEGHRKESELVESNCIKVGKKILDLELPAYEYIDSEPEESLAEETNPSENLQKIDVEPCRAIDDASFSLRTKCFADLNEPIKPEEEVDSEYNGFLHPVPGYVEIEHQDLPGKGNSQLQFQTQVIRNTNTTEDPQSSPDVMQLDKDDGQQEFLYDNDEDDDEVDGVCEISPSLLLDLNSGNLLTKRKYECGSSSLSSLRKHTLDLVRTPIVQALPCYRSSALLSGISKQRSHQYAGDISCPAINLESEPDDGNKKHINGSMDLMLTRDIDLNSISPCYSPDVVANGFCLADVETKFKGLTEETESSKKLDSDCISMPDLGEQLIAGDLDSVSRPDNKSSGSKFHVDLNSYISEDESLPLPSPSTEVELHAPESPENKERSPPRGDSDKNQLDMPCELLMLENGKPEEDLVTMAAEAIVSISSSEVQSNSTTSPSEALKGDLLYWFAKLASSVVDDPDSEFGVVLCCKKPNHHNEYSTDEIDSFEAMTLQLEETKAEEYCCNTSIQEESASLARRGRTRRGRQQRKDFQNEILPSLASLSRYEVSEDLQAIGGLIEAAQCSSGGRRTGRNGWSRGRRGRPSLSSKAEMETETSLCMALDQQNRHGECSVEERNIIDWGKITRRRRGQRCPANNPRLIVSQV